MEKGKEEDTEELEKVQRQLEVEKKRRQELLKSANKYNLEMK